MTQEEREKKVKKLPEKIEKILNYHAISNEDCIHNRCLCSNQILALIIEFID